jgi:hypothetical protein
MNWNGQSVALWSAAGFNSFNWWPFSNLVQPPKAYLFGWRPDPVSGQINDVHSAGLWSGSFALTDGPVTVRPTAAVGRVPEPATLSLIILGIAGAGVRWRHRKQPSLGSSGSSGR